MELSPAGTALLAFGVVFLGMTLIALVLFALRALGRARPARSPAAAPAGVGRELAPGELAPELVAVLAAAAQATFGPRARVHRVHVHGEPGAQSWSRAGRLDVLASHRVAPKRPG